MGSDPNSDTGLPPDKKYTAQAASRGGATLKYACKPCSDRYRTITGMLPCVVSMGVGDDGTVNRPPRVNIKIPRWTVQAFRPLNNQVLHSRSMAD